MVEQLYQVDHYLREWSFSGVMLIADRNQMLLHKSYAYADKERGIPTRLDTEFKIASVTKIFTAVAILQLCERGLVHLEDALDKFGIINGALARHITVHSLLSMTSGISVVQRAHDRQQPVSLPELATIAASSLLDSKAFSYSNGNYNILAYIIECVTGTKYGEYIRSFIFGPSNMSNSYVHDGRARPKQAIDYCNGLAAKHYDPSWTVGAGNIWSTAYDLYQFDCALHGGKLLSADMLRLMCSSFSATGFEYAAQRGSWYGYGLVTTPVSGYSDFTHGHGGGTGGFTAYLLRYVKPEATVVLLSNDDVSEVCIESLFERIEIALYAT